jgi:hypothetical protein
MSKFPANLEARKMGGNQMIVFSVQRGIEDV